MFYNEVQKNRYIENSRFANSTLDVSKRIFTGACRVELQEDMDLSLFNRKQVLNLLKSFNSKSKGYYKVVCSLFADYYNWCLNEGLVDITNVTNWYESNLSNVIIDEVLPIDSLRDKFFTSEYAEECLSKIPDPVNKLLFYAPYMGIDGKDHIDLKHLRVEDLHEKRNAIQLRSGNVAFVDDLFIKLLKDADTVKRYIPNGEVGYGNKRINYAESMYVFKHLDSGKKNEVITNNIIINRYSLIRKQVGNKFINISTIYRNGLINAIKKHYEEQGISLYKAFFHEINNKLYTYDKETQEVISKYNSKITVRTLRMELKDSIEYYM